MSYGDRFKHPGKGFDLSLAIEEANRCVLCVDAPCSKGCPGDTKPAEFIRKLRMRNITGAIRTIKTNNILGGTCGILCPVASLCEKECSTKLIDKPIKIGKIQEALIKHSWELDVDVFEKPEPREEKIAVVGAGPAGLSCASELAKDGYQVTIFEAKEEPGGVLRYGVPSYRYPDTFLQKELEDVENLGVKIKCSSPVKGKKAIENLLEQDFEAVFVAPGLWRQVRLDEESPAIDGVFTAINFLDLVCREQYSQLQASFENKVVAVIGGGSTSMDCVESAVRLGARDVYLIYRRSYTQMLIEEIEKVSAMNEGIHFLLLNQPKGYQSDDQNKLTGLRLVRTRLGEADESGRRRPVEIPGSNWVLEVDAVVEAIGTRPDADSPDWYPSVGVSNKKKIEIDPETGETTREGIFAGGDITDGPELVIKAVQDGKNSAAAIKVYLESRRQK